MTDVPEIRFKGYTDAWEQRKLGEVAETTFWGGTPSTSNYDFWNGNIPWIQSSDISEHNVSNVNLRKYITEKGLETSAAKLVPAKSIAVVIRVGVGKLSVVPFDFATSQDFLSLANLNIDIWFGVYALYKRMQKEITYVQGTSIKGITKDELLNIIMSIPSTLPEQIAIGRFIHTLDNTITLHQRKLDGLKKLKAGYLQQMFPQAGESVPKVRFTGFVGGWKTRELGTISIKVTQKNKNSEFTETFTNSAEYGIINQRDFFDKDISNEKNLDGYYIVQPNDFVYNPRISNYAPVGPIKRNLLGRTGVMSPLYYVFRIVDGDFNFIEKYFESISWHEFMKLNGDNGVRSDRFNIKDSVFEKMPIQFPKYQEQTAIGNFFRNIDEQITNQSQKLEQIKQLKSAYLQKMFV